MKKPPTRLNKAATQLQLDQAAVRGVGAPGAEYDGEERAELDKVVARSTTGDLLNVIEELSRFEAIGVTRLARNLGIPVPTGYRMLRALERAGYVEQFRDSKEYRLTLKIFEIGCQVANRTTIWDVAALEIERLSQQSGLTANLGVRVDNEVLYLAKIETEEVLTLNVQPGSRVPVTCTAMGKAMLEVEIGTLRSIVGLGPYPARTPYSITSYDDLVVELREVQRRGYAVDRQELNIGLACVAAPILGTRRDQYGAVSVSVYGRAMDEAEVERLGRLVIACAHRVSLRAGALLGTHSWVGTGRASYPRP